MRRRTLVLLAGGLLSTVAVVGLHSSAVVSAGTWSTVNQFSTIGPWSPVAQLAQAPVALASELVIASKQGVNFPQSTTAASVTTPVPQTLDSATVPLSMVTAPLAPENIGTLASTLIAGKAYIVSIASAGRSLSFSKAPNGLLNCELRTPGVKWARLVAWPLVSGTPDMADPIIISCLTSVK